MKVFCKLCAVNHDFKVDDIRESVDGTPAIAIPCGFVPLTLVEFVDGE